MRHFRRSVLRPVSCTVSDARGESTFQLRSCHTYTCPTGRVIVLSWAMVELEQLVYVLLPANGSAAHSQLVRCSDQSTAPSISILTFQC